MAEIFDFGEFFQEKFPEDMNREELLAYLSAIREQIARLDEEEPRDMSSEAHEAWGERHEELEDMVDEIRDLLDEW